MWQLALIDCLLSFHLQKYSPLVGSCIDKIILQEEVELECEHQFEIKAVNTLSAVLAASQISVGFLLRLKKAASPTRM